MKEFQIRRFQILAFGASACLLACLCCHPAVSPPATQPADASEPYRQLYARYKAMILTAVRAGDADEVAKLTVKFNRTGGGRLLYVRVQRLVKKSGEQDKWEMLLDRHFTEKRLSLPNINYRSAGRPHVSFADGYVLILPAKLGGGKYEDDVYITMAVESAAVAQPATRPTSSATTQPTTDNGPLGDPLAGKDDFSRLTLEVTTSGTSFLPMELVPITFTLVNKTPDAITARTTVMPGAGFLEIRSAVGEGPFERFSPAGPWALASVEMTRRAWKPGQSESDTGYLYYANSGRAGVPRGRYFLPEPGTYRAKAVLEDADSGQKIESNVVVVEARKPSGQDGQAYAFLRKYDEGFVRHARLLTSIGEHTRTAAQQARVDVQEEFLKKFPDSRYARHVRLSLGITYSTAEGNDLPRGAKLLEEVCNLDDFFLAPDALRWLVQARLKQNDIAAAKELVATLYRRFPKSAQAMHAASLVNQAESAARESAARAAATQPAK